MEEIKVEKQNSGLLSGFGTSIGMSALMTGGFGSVTCAVRNRGVKKAIEQTKLNNNIVNNFLKNSKVSADSFTKAYSASKNYEELNRLKKAAKKADKALDKIAKKGRVSFLQKLKHGEGETLLEKIKNFSKNTNESITHTITKNKDLIDKQINNFESGKEELASFAIKAGKDAEGKTIFKQQKILNAGLKQNSKSLFKEELLNPINLIYAITSTTTRIKTEALPVFKEKGFIAGLKQTGVCIAKSAADIVSNAGFSTAFRLLGSRIGMIAGPAGASVGGLVGDIIGTFISNKIITKVFGENNNIIPQNSAENPESATEQQSNNADIEYTKQPTENTDYSNLSKGELLAIGEKAKAEANLAKKNSMLRYQA